MGRDKVFADNYLELVELMAKEEACTLGDPGVEEEGRTVTITFTEPMSNTDVQRLVFMLNDFMEELEIEATVEDN